MPSKPNGIIMVLLKTAETGILSSLSAIALYQL